MSKVSLKQVDVDDLAAWLYEDAFDSLVSLANDVSNNVHYWGNMTEDEQLTDKAQDVFGMVSKLRSELAVISLVKHQIDFLEK